MRIFCRRGGESGSSGSWEFAAIILGEKGWWLGLDQSWKRRKVIRFWIYLKAEPKLWADGLMWNVRERQSSDE